MDWTQQLVDDTMVGLHKRMQNIIVALNEELVCPIVNIKEKLKKLGFGETAQACEWLRTEVWQQGSDRSNEVAVSDRVVTILGLWGGQGTATETE